MPAPRIFKYFIITLFLFTPLVGKSVVAQVSPGYSITEESFVEYHKLRIRSVDNVSDLSKSSVASDLNFTPLTTIENNLAKNLNSHWVWSENTLDILDSYSPFLFRTKKSANVEEVKVLLQVNAMGRLSGFEVMSDVDKGLKERIDYVLRKLPDCKPVPGYDNYGIETFELIIKK
ncbi:hypothetical protein [Algoriphagus aquimarinus]|uniref:Uncharacterized protein n=1 Tax=Algoriphagus aquimarinus TaxID=237018 RepID=A0A1I0ZZC3_9BACT|nr:hypothetical protein [Algoriphagus aquimarinus]SFB31069.1 hypothetical protein SAMN04489723_10766 [Algoriphagus aquimarinus]